MKFSFCFILLAMALPLSAQALVCPQMPTSTGRDTEVKVKTEVGKIGPVKGAELEASVKNTTRDLLSALPAADKVYIEQMMFAAYCSSIQASSISESEKASQIFEYRKFLQKSLQENASDKKSERKSNGDFFSRRISVGGFAQGIDSLSANGISAELGKDTHGDLVMIYRTNALNEHWNVWQVVDEGRKLGPFWLTQYVSGTYYADDDAPRRSKTDHITRNCTPERMKNLIGSVVSIFGQPADVLPKKDLTGKFATSKSEVTNSGWVGAAVWKFNDGNNLLLIFRSGSQYVDFSGSRHWKNTDYCEIHLCGWNDQSFRYCPKVEGVNL